jgi:uncharacterized membrane protein
MQEILKTFLLSMVPIGELRAAIPLGISHYGLGVLQTYLIAVIGNFLPVALIVFLLEPVSNWLMKYFKFFRWFFHWLFEHSRKRHSKRFEVFEEVALVTFVAIPLPMTGAWSGALAAFVFGIPPKKSLPLIALGVAIAGVVVTVITLGFRFFL